MLALLAVITGVTPAVSPEAVCARCVQTAAPQSSHSIVCIDPSQTSVAHAPDYESLYGAGRTYLEFRDAATRRVEAWHDHYARATVPDTVRASVATLPGTWRLLVIAEDWCGDSANTIPYLAKLADVASNIDLRIIDSERGKDVMEAHRTMDGRTATPTVILLNKDFREAGCWVERPATLDEWFQANKNVLSEEDLYDQKYAWYAEDQGRETVREIVALIESAVHGETTCRAMTQ